MPDGPRRIKVAAELRSPRRRLRKGLNKDQCREDKAAGRASSRPFARRWEGKRRAPRTRKARAARTRPVQSTNCSFSVVGGAAAASSKARTSVPFSPPAHILLSPQHPSSFRAAALRLTPSPIRAFGVFHHPHLKRRGRGGVPAFVKADASWWGGLRRGGPHRGGGCFNCLPAATDSRTSRRKKKAK